MIRASALLALCPTELAAEACNWRGMWVSIEPGAEETAVVTFHNEITASWGDGYFYCPVWIDDVMIRAKIDGGYGNIPDTLIVEVPPGYEAVPPKIDVDEGMEAVVIVRPMLLGAL